MPSTVRIIKRVVRATLPTSALPYVRAAIGFRQSAARIIEASLTDLELRRRPVGFIIAGVQKGGSSALASFLSQHPEIAFCSIKEPNFFLKFKGISKTQYHRLYPRPRGRIAGEASVGVMYEPEAIQKLKLYNPGFKIILILRNPLERAYSHYKMHVRKHNLKLPFLECLRFAELSSEAKAQFLSSADDPEKAIHRCHSIFGNYIDWSRYTDRIENISKQFDDVLILKNDDLQNKHYETLNTVFQFLGVDSSLKVEQTQVHSSPPYTIPTDVRYVLEESLMVEIDRIECLTGWDLSDWRKRK